jgi:hypothetical protein
MIFFFKEGLHLPRSTQDRERLDKLSLMAVEKKVSQDRKQSELVKLW